jgi:hypothetical protein
MPGTSSSVCLSSFDNDVAQGGQGGLCVCDVNSFNDSGGNRLGGAFNTNSTSTASFVFSLASFTGESAVGQAGASGEGPGSNGNGGGGTGGAINNEVPRRSCRPARARMST